MCVDMLFVCICRVGVYLCVICDVVCIVYVWRVGLWVVCDGQLAERSKAPV